MAWPEVQEDLSRTSSLSTQSQRTAMSRKSSRGPETIGLSNNNKSRKSSRLWSSSERELTQLSEPTPNMDPNGFYHALSPEIDVPYHELRMSSSSASLGRLTNGRQLSNRSPPPQVPSLRKSGSWSNFSFLDPGDEPASAPIDQRRGSVKSLGSEGHRSEVKTKSSKRTNKPARLDLSLLFPKPKGNAPPLLSPRRYTQSPSPAASDISLGKAKKPGNKITKPPPAPDRRSSLNAVPFHPASRVSDRTAPPVPQVVSRAPSDATTSSTVTSKRKAMDWFDLPLERAMRFSHVPIKLEPDFTEGEAVETEGSELAPPAPTANDPAFSASSSPSFHISEVPLSPTETVSRDTIRLSKLSELPPSKVFPLDSIPSPISGSLISPTTRTSFYGRTANSPDSWRLDRDTESPVTRVVKPKLGKKSSRAALFTSDLTKSSVLSLSSSEDEYDGDDNDEAAFDFDNEVLQFSKQTFASRNTVRDSIATYDYIEPEICTAEAVVPARHPSLTKVETKTDHGVPRVRELRRNTSNASSVTSSTVASPQYHSLSFPKHETSRSTSHGNRPTGVTGSGSGKRRSRIIAVTRQEESLLEAMRQRNGRFTPSMLIDMKVDVTDSEQGSSNLATTPHSARSVESVLSGDTSFLRLSGMPPPVSEAGVADSSQKLRPETTNSTGNAPPRSKPPPPPLSSLASAISDGMRLSVSDGLASPRSPITPTIPLHRLPPQSPPPNRAPPPIPDSPRHSRRRTDSSGALVLSDAGSEKRENPHDFPLWAVKWSRNAADAAIVH